MLMNFFKKIQSVMDISEKPKLTVSKVEEIVKDEIEEVVENKKDESKEDDVDESSTYVHEFGKCVLLEYNEIESGSNIGCNNERLIENYSVASHNIPYGTIIYIPALKGKINKDGIFKVMDTGGHCFDFDIFLSKDNIGKVGSLYEDVYVLEWGNGKIVASYTYIIEYYIKKGILSRYAKAWDNYKSKGKLIKFFKFKDEDKGIEERDYYNL